MRRDVVLILLIDEEGRFLLQHRDDTAPTYPGYWGFFGGSIEDGETPLEAIRREAWEELRYTPAGTNPVLTIDYKNFKTGRSGRKFYFTELCPDKDALQLYEGQNMGWFTLPEAQKLKIRDSNLAALESILGLGSGKSSTAGS